MTCVRTTNIKLRHGMLGTTNVCASKTFEQRLIMFINYYKYMYKENYGYITNDISYNHKSNMQVITFKFSYAMEYGYITK